MLDRIVVPHAIRCGGKDVGRAGGIQGVTDPNVLFDIGEYLAVMLGVQRSGVLSRQAT
jgi:hypothetical protein